MGKHLILDCSGANNISFEDVFQMLEILPGKIGMNELTKPYVVKGADYNPGYTGFVIIEQSHISIHTFTNSDLVAIDVYSCKDFDEEIVLKFIKNKKIKIIDFKVIKRMA